MSLPDLTLKSAWASYDAGVLPDDAPAVQRTECRRAFYAGCHAVLQMMLGLGEPDVPEEFGTATLQSWADECEEFKRRVANGQA